MSTVGRSASAASIVRSIAGWLIETIGGWPRRPTSSLMNSTARPSEVRMLALGITCASARTAASRPTAWKIRRTSSSMTAARGSA